MKLPFNISSFSFYILMSIVLVSNTYKKILWRTLKFLSWLQYFIEMVSGMFLYLHIATHVETQFMFALFKMRPGHSHRNGSRLEGTRKKTQTFCIIKAKADSPIILVSKPSHFSFINHFRSAESPLCLLFQLFCVLFQIISTTLGTYKIAIYHITRMELRKESQTYLRRL